MAGQNLGKEKISSMHESTQWDKDLLKIRLWNFSFAWGIPLGKLQKIEFHRHSSEMVFLEIFAGSGNLSTAVKDINLSVYAIDNKAKRHSQVSIHVLDLTKQSDVAVLLDLTCHANIASAHLAPPCGTASKARERPLPESLAHIKADPLRSEQQPLGLEGLTGLDASCYPCCCSKFTLCTHNCGFPNFVCAWIYIQRGESRQLIFLGSSCTVDGTA